jgi:hypothetical protein
MVSGRTQYQKPQLGLASTDAPVLPSEGHAGAMLQARRLGEDLLVGIHSDEDIMDNKGPTVMTLKERLADIEDMRTNFDLLLALGSLLLMPADGQLYPSHTPLMSLLSLGYHIMAATMWYMGMTLLIVVGKTVIDM